MRSSHIRRHILDTLASAQGYGLQTSTVESHVGSLVRPPLKAVEFAAEVEALVAADYVGTVENPLDATQPLLILKEKGRVLLAQL